jgi:hypothetical protein
MNSFDDIWNDKNQSSWNNLLKNYWTLVQVENIQVEYELNRLSIQTIASMNEMQWYTFLHDKYFVWKYTAKNRLATTRSQLRRYEESRTLSELNGIRKEILSIDTDDIKSSLATVCEIKGLGIAGASGLLSLMFPKYFATVDQFVVKALLEVESQKHLVEHMNPDGLTLKNGVVLTEMIREKASSMNEVFHTNFWTPRTIEMALWAYRS